MKKPKKPAHVSQEDWDSVDSPPLTEEEMANMRPLREVDPALAGWSAEQKRKRGQRGRQKAPTKVGVYLMVDPDVLDAFKAKGKGYQTRMNTALRKEAGL